MIRVLMGYHQGDIKKHVDFLFTHKDKDTNEDIHFFVVRAESDRGIVFGRTLDGADNDKLVRCCQENQKDKLLEHLSKVTFSAWMKGKVLDLKNALCSLDYTQKRIYCDFNLLKFLREDTLIETIKSHNERVKREADAQKEAANAKRLAEEEQAKREQLEAAEQAIAVGNSVDAQDLILLADTHQIKVPLRTRGWILNSLEYISQKQYSFMGKKGKGSTKVFEIYLQIKQAVLNKQGVQHEQRECH